ncbi:MAG: bifunctional demethylmenaquinone methyltransferase/2-methoxy-6-polyprenyl-1,4-benzoquinol methylase UbiE [Flavobacteriales bacterium]|nr:bifunctional demethylmenaquinone methyltransferase/2-methoxy-6-polyprenyl-1,4-benzoquinol methylase UbiE [Flavobacteriales bacterium]
MFDNIAHKYDFLNHLLSLGIDRGWRKKAIKMVAQYKPKQILDLATGTGDFAFMAMRLKPEHIEAADISEGMLEVGRQKNKKKGFSNIIDFVHGDSENLKYPDNHFDLVTIGFGVRNFENLKKGLAEMRRVIKADGHVCIIEFSKPRKFPMKQLFAFYSKYILPLIGRLFSKDTSAYTYLPESSRAFPDGSDFISIMDEIGYSETFEKRLTGGIATIYLTKK